MKFVNTVLCLFFVTFPVIAGEVFYSSTYRLVAKDSSDEIRLRCFQEYKDNMGLKKQIAVTYITIHSKEVDALVTISPHPHATNLHVYDYEPHVIRISGSSTVSKCPRNGNVNRPCWRSWMIDRNSGHMTWWSEFTIAAQRLRPDYFGKAEPGKGVNSEFQCKLHKKAIP